MHGEKITISQEVIREKARQFWPVLYPGKDMPISAMAGSVASKLAGV
jgi:hypothetical protein